MKICEKWGLTGEVVGTLCGLAKIVREPSLLPKGEQVIRMCPVDN